MRTTADEHRDEAIKNINAAALNLAKIVVEDCEGHDAYTKEYTAKLHQVFNELMSIKKRMSE
jgi:hypothetical protein